MESPESSIDLSAADAWGPVMADMTWPELKAAVDDDYGVLLPVGATEQHGPHLPLATDCLLPLAVARGVAAQTKTLIATPIYYGCVSKPLSGGGQGFPGTTSIRGNTMIALIRDIIGEFIRSGFTKITLLTWHVENRAFVYEGADLAMDAAAPTRARVLSIDHVLGALDRSLIDKLFPEGFPGWDIEHASVMETSLMLALYPDMVRTDRIIDDHAERRPSYDMIPAPMDTIPSSGVLYKASRGTREYGEMIYQAAVEIVTAAIRREFGS
jgi:creatinine amidohydrolase